MKKYFLFILLAIISLSLFFLSSCTSNCSPKACSGDVCFNLEIPNSSEDRMRGLMHREFLPKDEGMLFIFERLGNHSFWMKNTLIPLDMIWLDEQFKIVHIENAVPCTNDPCKVYYPSKNAMYVLEINQGLAESNNLFEGDSFEFHFCN